LRDSVRAIALSQVMVVCFPALLAEQRLAKDTTSISVDIYAERLLEEEAACAWLQHALAPSGLIVAAVIAGAYACQDTPPLAA